MGQLIAAFAGASAEGNELLILDAEARGERCQRLTALCLRELVHLRGDDNGGDADRREEIHHTKIVGRRWVSRVDELHDTTEMLAGLQVSFDQRPPRFTC